MADKTPIEWTDATWNPIVGCSVVSPGCTNCYAMRMAARIERMGTAPHYAGTTKVVNGHPVWTGAVNLAPDSILTAPMKWRRPRRIFVNSMSDLFHASVPDEWIDKVFAVMAMAPQHTFQLLTKRPERMRKYLGDPTRCTTVLDACLDYVTVPGAVHPRLVENGVRPLILPNVWLGVSVEDQRRADERIPLLLDTPAAVRWVSAEPLLGPLNLTRIGGTTCLAHAGACCGDRPWTDALRGIQACSRAGAYSFPMRDQMPRGLDWVVAGGESGPGARPMHPGWARSLRDQCAAAGVPFLFKQWGEWAAADDYPSEIQEQYDVQGLTDGQSIRVGKKAAGRLLDGVIHDAYPEVRSHG